MDNVKLTGQQGLIRLGQTKLYETRQDKVELVEG